jgi:hypothetical protein
MKEMTPPFAPEPKFFEHPRYAEFLAGLTDDGFGIEFEKQSSEFKEVAFSNWLKIEERKEDIKDFKNLVPMHIRMNTEEWNWFSKKLEEEKTEFLPNLRALVKHPPKAFKDLK